MGNMNLVVNAITALAIIILIVMVDKKHPEFYGDNTNIIVGLAIANMIVFIIGYFLSKKNCNISEEQQQVFDFTDDVVTGTAEGVAEVSVGVAEVTVAAAGGMG